MGQILYLKCVIKKTKQNKTSTFQSSVVFKIGKCRWVIAGCPSSLREIFKLGLLKNETWLFGAWPGIGVFDKQPWQLWCRLTHQGKHINKQCPESQYQGLRNGWEPPGGIFSTGLFQQVLWLLVDLEDKFHRMILTFWWDLDVQKA